jgi:hypothetical protein
MNQTTPGSTNMLNNFTFNRTSSGTLSLANQMQITGVVTHTAGTLATGDSLILRAIDTTTYGQIAGTGTGDITGNVTAEYYIDSSADIGWKDVCSPFTGNTIADLSDDMNINTGTPSTTLPTYTGLWKAWVAQAIREPGSRLLLPRTVWMPKGSRCFSGNPTWHYQ